MWDVTSALQQHAERKGIITGAPTSPRGPRLSYLSFSDDSMIFYKDNSVEWRRIMQILGIYEKGSGDNS
jgi:hypothetical protein